MKKISIIVLTFFVFLVLAGCNKESNVQQQSVQISLSKEILDYDEQVRKLNFTQEWTEKDTKQLLIVATADLKTAWDVFKFVSKFAGAGYGAAAGVISGIGGSIYAWWLNKESAVAKVDNPHIAPPGTNIPSNAGMWHNKFMYDILVEEIAGTENIDSMVSLTYPSLVESVCEVYGLNNTEMQTVVTVDDYKAIVLKGSETQNIDSIINFAYLSGYSVNLLEYYRAFLNRAANPELFTYDIAKNYTELFLDDVELQTSLTIEEKNQMTVALSVYLNSLKYWKYTLE